MHDLDLRQRAAAHFGRHALHELLVRVVAVRQVERRLTQLNGKHEHKRQECGNAHDDHGKADGRDARNIEGAQSQEHAHGNEEHRGFIGHDLQRFAVGANLGIRRARRIRGHDEEQRRKRDEEDAHQEVAACEEHAAADNREHEREGDVGAFDGVHAHVVFLDELAHVVIGLQQRRSNAALHASRDFTVETCEHAANHGAGDGEQHNAEQRLQQALVHRGKRHVHGKRRANEVLGAHLRTRKARDQAHDHDHSSHDSGRLVEHLLAEKLIHVPVARGGLHFTAQRAAEQSLVGIDGDARHIHRHGLLLRLRHAKRAEEHNDHGKRDDRHDVHVVDADVRAKRAIRHNKERLHEQIRQRRHAYAGARREHRHKREGEPFALMNGKLHILFVGSDAGELAEPFAPEHERRGAAECEQHEQQHFARRCEARKRRPLRNEHAERSHEHSHDAEHHEASQARHALEQAVHVFDVAAADVMFGGADAQEQQRLRHSVENDQENGRPHRFRGANASAGDDQAQVGDGRVREHALGVALRDGHEGSQAEREAANEHDHGRSHGENQEQRRKLDEQEAAGLHHGGRMQKRAGGRRRDHSAQKPRVERHLRRLRHAGEREQRHGQNEHAGRGGIGDGRIRGGFQEHAEQARLALKAKPENCRLECEAAQHVHDDLAERIVDSLFGLREADEQERAQRGDFPSRVNPAQVIGKHNVVHRRKEREHEREEPRAAVFLLGMMRLKIFHVAKRVHANARADDAQDEHHDDAERVNMHLAFELHLALNIVFKPQRGKNLANCQHERQHAAILHRVAHDV